MSEQNYEERFEAYKFTPVVERDTTNPESNLDPMADKVPVEADQIHETPMGGTVAAVDPINRPLEPEIPLYETPIQEIPMGGTVAAAGPMNEMPVRVIPVGEAVPAVSLMNEKIVDEAPLSPTIPYQAPVVESVPADENLVKKPVAYEAPKADMMNYEPLPAKVNAGSLAALLESGESEHFRTRWNEIQGKFVDDPRTAVQQADVLVTEVVEHITQMFAKEHTSLETQWNQGSDVSTEDLRKALQHYRTFFNRLVI